MIYNAESAPILTGCICKYTRVACLDENDNIHIIHESNKCRNSIVVSSTKY